MWCLKQQDLVVSLGIQCMSVLLIVKISVLSYDAIIQAFKVWQILQYIVLYDFLTNYRCNICNIGVMFLKSWGKGTYFNFILTVFEIYHQLMIEYISAFPEVNMQNIVINQWQ